MNDRKKQSKVSKQTKRDNKQHQNQHKTNIKTNIKTNKSEAQENIVGEGEVGERKKCG